MLTPGNTISPGLWRAASHYMLGTLVFYRSNLTYEMAKDIIDIMNEVQPRYDWQTDPLYGWRLLDSGIADRLCSAFVELAFQDTPQERNVYG